MLNGLQHNLRTSLKRPVTKLSLKSGLLQVYCKPSMISSVLPKEQWNGVAPLDISI